MRERSCAHILGRASVAIVNSMFTLQKLLLPVVSADTSRHVVLQAAWFALRFHAEIILLHVVTPFSYPAGFLESGHQMTERDSHAQVVERAQADLEQLRPELDGIVVTPLLLRGNPATEIVETARDRNVDLILMPTGGVSLGSVTAKVLRESHCPVWTGVHLEDAVAREFSIRHILCSVDLSPHSRHTASLAAQMAAAVDARLTLVHITSSVESFGPGGSYVDPVWKERLFRSANEQIAQLQQEVGTNAEVIIDSGNVPQLLNQAAERTKADVLVIGHLPGRSHLGDNGEGYGIIRESRIPVLSL
jgi:nucleotide-binding universal stress UspA family protein